MKKHTKSDKEDVPEVIPSRSNKKNISKPWTINFSYTDESKIKDSFFHRTRKVGEWIDDTWYKFITPEDAVRELNKRARSYFGNKPGKISDLWQFSDKKFRLYNKESNEIIPLTIGDDEIYITNEKD